MKHPREIGGGIADRDVAPVDDAGDGSGDGITQDVLGREVIVHQARPLKQPHLRVAEASLQIGSPPIEWCVGCGAAHHFEVIERFRPELPQQELESLVRYAEVCCFRKACSIERKRPSPAAVAEGGSQSGPS